MVKILLYFSIVLAPIFSGILPFGMLAFQPQQNADMDDPIALLTADTGTLSLYLIIGLVGFILFISGIFVNKRRSRRQEFAFTNGKRSNAVIPEINEDNIEEFEHRSNATTKFSPTVFETQASPAILVVEANDDMQKFITNALRLNYRVLSVKDGLVAYQKAVATVPDLIIIDTNLAGMDGMTLCHNLKSTDATSHIPILMLTHKGETATDADEVQLHADDFLIQPFDARALLINVKELIGLKKRLQVAFRDELVQGGTSLFELYPHDLEFLRRLNQIIEKHYSDHQFGVENLSEQINLTRLQLYRKMKALINKSPGDYLRLYRIEKAKRLLQGANLQVSDVAHETGFASITNFTKAFRAMTGLNPRDFSVQVRSASDSLFENQ